MMRKITNLLSEKWWAIRAKLACIIAGVPSGDSVFYARGCMPLDLIIFLRENHIKNLIWQDEKYLSSERVKTINQNISDDWRCFITKKRNEFMDRIHD